MFVKEKAAGEVKELSINARILLKAADLMEEHGICYNTSVQAGHICTGYAVGLASVGISGNAALSGIDMAFRRQTGLPMVEWNDRKRPTTAQSAAMLRHVATKV